ncbi:uncharacterized protein J7T54_004836 [Emericellopsis cladophorae]|uniref:Uncharacterized protein n=1 Tax=Emericellopsis cladophorae TaxID=2686198 RepID=A0A9P9Y789_9HYPO|nr:uncharacterized protein J7T54_004836 [Emericellopsis cladophorae]KAI6784290.1 hypothetical protein J7T54_004836 [Emericellopsis cladophorae]
MTSRLAGKHAAIIGATGSIGSSIAKAFAQQGAVLSLLGRTALDAQRTLGPQLTPYQPLAGDSSKAPTEHRFIKLDVTSSAELKRLFSSRKATDDAVGAVDILVNCAGITQTTILKRTHDEDIEKVMDTNLTSAILACKHAQINDNGCILNVSSLMATRPAIGAAVYTAAKAGMIGLTSALSLELAPRSVRANALLPGWVESPMWNNLKPDLKEQYLKRIPARRVAAPEEVADAAVFLAANSYANNCILNLDGGLSAA